MSDDLWGELPVADQTEHPKFILREQTKQLEKKSEGYLTGNIEIRSGSLPNNWDTTLTYELVCPALNNYTFRLLRLCYNMIHVFPLEFNWNADGGGTVKAVCTNSEDFKDRLKEVFQSQRVRTAIAALLRDASR